MVFSSHNLASLWLEAIRLALQAIGEECLQQINFQDSSHVLDSITGSVRAAGAGVPWVGIGEDIGLLLAAHSLNFKAEQALLTEMEWLRSSSLFEVNWSLKNELFDRSNLTVAKIKAAYSLSSPSILSTNANILPYFIGKDISDSAKMIFSYHVNASFGIILKPSQIPSINDNNLEAKEAQSHVLVKDTVIWIASSVAVNKDDNLLLVFDENAFQVGDSLRNVRKNLKSKIAFDLAGASLSVGDFNEDGFVVQVADAKITAVAKDFMASRADIQTALSEGYVDIAIRFRSAKDLFYFCMSIGGNVASVRVHKIGQELAELTLSDFSSAERAHSHSLNDLARELVSSLSDHLIASSCFRSLKVSINIFLFVFFL